MFVSNLKIVLDNGSQLDYEDASSLGIKLNRVVDDFNNPSKRFGEFSYTFSIPKNKINRIAFEFPDAKGRTRVFNGKQFGCKILNNNDLIHDGIIELKSFDKDSYNLLFFSSVTQLLDELKSKKLIDIESLPIIPWNNEQTVIAHINNNYTIDQKDFQFLMAFYVPPVMTGATGQGITSNLKDEDVFGYYYGYLTSNLNYGNKNPFGYYQKFPPAIYLRSIIRAMLADAGWTLGGTFFEDQDIKRLIVPFTGNAEDFTGSISSGQLDLNKVLPDIGQSEFLNSVINLFNLYFTIDVKGKQINFETFNTMFRSTFNPYDITNKIDTESIQISKPDTEPKISFTSDSNNALVAGYNRIFDYSAVIAGEKHPTWAMNVNNVLRVSMSKPKLTETYNKDAYSSHWNKTSGEKEIKLNFAPCNYYSYAIINERSRTNTTYSSAKYGLPAFSVGIPLISDQTPQDSKGKFFSQEGEDYCKGNDVANMAYDGGLKLLYYYGLVAYDFPLTGSSSPTVAYNQFSWIGIATGGTCVQPTMRRVVVPIASPYKLLNNREKNDLVTTISNFTGEKYSKAGAEAQGLLTTWYSASKADDGHIYSNFSLTMGEDSLYPNLYSKFHESKYNNLRNGSLLKATMTMNSFDWSEMQIYRPVLYDREVYRLVSINNYDPINQIAEINLLKYIGVGISLTEQFNTTTTTTTTLAPIYANVEMVFIGTASGLQWRGQFATFYETKTIIIGTGSSPIDDIVQMTNYVTVSASKLSNGGIAERQINITVKRNGSVEGTASFVPGDYVGTAFSMNVTGCVNSDFIQLIVQEQFF